MKSLAQKLQGLSPAITEICEISDNAGLSVGVVHQGEVIHRANFGYRDLENKSYQTATLSILFVL